MTSSASGERTPWAIASDAIAAYETETDETILGDAALCRLFAAAIAHEREQRDTLPRELPIYPKATTEAVTETVSLQAALAPLARALHGLASVQDGGDGERCWCPWMPIDGHYIRCRDARAALAELPAAVTQAMDAEVTG